MGERTEGFSGLDSSSFIHVVIHTFSNGTHLRRDDFDLKDGLERFVVHPHPETSLHETVFVRGSLSLAWIDALETRYKIDPELFRRHL